MSSADFTAKITPPTSDPARSLCDDCSAHDCHIQVGGYPQLSAGAVKVISDLVCIGLLPQYQ